MARWALGLAGLLAAAAGCGADGTVLGIPNRDRPKLLYTATNEPTGIEDFTTLRDQVAAFSQGPFDGLNLDVGLGDGPWGDVVYTRAMFDAEVERDAGLRGIFFDVVAYTEPVWAFSGTPDGQPFAAVETQARRRGAEFMTAMLQVKPDITILLTIAFSEVFRAVCLAGRSLDADRYSLLPAFLDGMFEARATLQAPAQIIDGFTASYTTVDPRSFPLYRELVSGNWEGVQERWHPGIVSFRFGDGVIPWNAEPSLTCPADVQGKLTRDLPVTFGIRMDADTLIGEDFHTSPADFGMNHFTPDALATALTAALASAERYVFLWSHTVDWLGVSSAPPPPAEYVEAVMRARAGAP